MLMNVYNFFLYCLCYWRRLILIVIGIFISVLILLIPLMFIFVTAFSEGFLVIKKNLNDQDMLHAIYLTVFLALLSVPLNSVIGVLLSWLVTRFKFIGRQLLLILVNIPIGISPIVAGLLYLLLYGNNGFLGSWLNSHNIQIVFAWPGMLLVMIFVSFPIIVHELVPVMLSCGTEEDETAILLGASGWQMFWHVTFKNIRWPLLTGITLTNARVIGEFGAVSIVSGLIRGETYTLSLQVELLYQDYNTVGAFIASALLSLIAIFVLFIKNIFNNRFRKNYV